MTDTADAPDPAWLGRATWGFVLLGVTLRVASYLLDFPLWWDEAFVGVNLLRRGYLDLLRPLDYGQVAPILFLWAERWAVGTLGFSEWSLRLFPLVAAVASVFLFRGMATRLLGARAGLLAVAIFAVSVHPIRHASDAKPYAFDLLAALVIQRAGLAWLRDRQRASGLWWLAGAIPIAVLGSHPAVFVAAGLGLALAWPAWRSGRASVRAALVTSGLALVATSAAIFLGFTRAQAASASPGMREMWARSFPPLGSALGLVRWLATVHSGDMLAYPCGGESGASAISLALAIVGAVGLWRLGLRAELGVILGPMGVALVAAAARVYPYGGPAPHGSAARIMQYARAWALPPDRPGGVAGPGQDPEPEPTRSPDRGQPGRADPGRAGAARLGRVPSLSGLSGEGGARLRPGVLARDGRGGGGGLPPLGPRRRGVGLDPPRRGGHALQPGDRVARQAASRAGLVEGRGGSSPPVRPRRRDRAGWARGHRLAGQDGRAVRTPGPIDPGSQPGRTGSPADPRAVRGLRVRAEGGGVGRIHLSW